MENRDGRGNMEGSRSIEGMGNRESRINMEGMGEYGRYGK